MKTKEIIWRVKPVLTAMAAAGTDALPGGGTAGAPNGLAAGSTSAVRPAGSKTNSVDGVLQPPPAPAPLPLPALVPASTPGLGGAVAVLSVVVVVQAAMLRWRDLRLAWAARKARH